MAVPITYETQHFGNRVIAANLEEAKISDKVPLSPEPGNIYRKDGVLHYFNDDIVDLPIHEYSLTDIEIFNEIGTVLKQGRKATITLSPASGTKPGLITPEHYALLAGASDSPIPGSLVLRDIETGTVQFSTVETDQLIVLNTNPDNPASAANVGYVGEIIERVVATTNATASQNVASIIPTPPLLATRSGQNVTIDILPASALAPGALSAEQYKLLAGATSADVPGSLILRGTEDPEGGFIPTEINSVRASYISTKHIYSDTAGIGNITFTGNKILGVTANPTSPAEAVSLGYVQNQLQNVAASQSGRDVKDDVYYTYDINVPLTGAPPAQEGVAAPANKSYLLTAQTNAAQNGAYLWNGTTWVRREDSDVDSLSAGAVYPTISGKYAGMLWMLTTATFTLDTDPLNFMNASDMILDGDGLVRDGRTIHVRGKEGQIQVSADEVAIASNYVGQPSLTIVGRIQQGTWNADVISQEFGGTGSNTLQGSQQNLGIESTVISVLGDASAKVFRVAHGLGTMDVSVDGLYLGQSTFIDHSPIDPDTVEIRASLGSNPIPTNSLRVKITGLRNNTNATTVAATAVT